MGLMGNENIYYDNKEGLFMKDKITGMRPHESPVKY